MTEAKPRTGQVWQKNGSDRKVRIAETDYRWAEARNVDTGRISRIELNTFLRKGAAGWTRIDEAACPESLEPGAVGPERSDPE